MKTEVDFLSDFTLQLHVLFIRIVKSEIGEVSVHEYKECERDRKVALYRDKGKQENAGSLGHLHEVQVYTVLCTQLPNTILQEIRSDRINHKGKSKSGRASNIRYARQVAGTATWLKALHDVPSTGLAKARSGS